MSMLDFEHAELSITGGGYKIRFVSTTVALVRSPAGQTYRVDAERRTCSCRAGVFRGQCKHLDFITELVDMFEWTEEGAPFIDLTVACRNCHKRHHRR
jgi:hypothetical protein